MTRTELFPNAAHLNKLVQRGVGGIVGNEEPHVFVGDLDGGGSVHSSHRESVTTYRYIDIPKAKRFPQSKNTCKQFELEGMSNKCPESSGKLANENPPNFFEVGKDEKQSKTQKDEEELAANRRSNLKPLL